MRRIPTWWKQPSFLEFKKQYLTNKDDALFFLGSGISIQASLPNWQGLLEHILEQSKAYLKEPITLKELSDLYKKLSQSEAPVALKKPRDLFALDKGLYPDIGSHLQSRLDEVNKGYWRDILNGLFNNPHYASKKSAIHEEIVSLEWHDIVTTNYDSLIEDTYKRVTGAPLFVAGPNSDNELSLDRRKKERFVYKIHGDIRDPKSLIVLTRESYDFIYDKSNVTRTQATLKSVLRQASVILFAGYSHDDETMRSFYKDAMEHTQTGNAFALVPMEGDITQIEKKISRLTSEIGVKFIGYSTDDDHRELVDFFRYLGDPDSYDASLNLRINAKRPTIIMLYCGGTIGSTKAESEIAQGVNPLQVSKIPSRFHPKLGAFSDQLLEWYQDTYNLGGCVAIDIKWEVLPEQYQVFSENATPELWNVVLKKIENVVFKYFQAPKIIGDATYLEPRENKQLSEDYLKVLDLFDEERKEFKEFFKDQDKDRELSPAQFISDFQSRYVLGILLLTGTDTMGYLVSALSFGFQHTPCSMIVTGSNQPPDESKLGQLQFLNRSDAWKNILTSFYFLQSFGHTLTDGFICFGDTIHHGVNARKIASELGPSSASLSRDIEPFVFRNLHIRGQYMFRLIDGVFCNNYYPSAGIPYATLVGIHGKDLDLRHIRRDPLQSDPDNSKLLLRDSFCDNTAICHIVASPSLPLIDVKGMCASKNGSSLRLAIIEGYASGTYPTQRSSNFEQLLYDLYQHAIPIHLISQYGMSEKKQRYETELIREINVPVTIMSGLTIETALPILALVINAIRQEEWGEFRPSARQGAGHNPKADKFLKLRMNLIEKHLNSLYTARPNILTLEIVPDKITKREKSDEANEARSNVWPEIATRKDKIRRRGKILLEIFEKLDELLRFNYVFLYKRDYSVLVTEIARRDESKGAGPDGFTALSDLGFEYGVSLVHVFTDTLSIEGEHGYAKLFQREPAVQKALLDKATEIVENITQLLCHANIANVHVIETSFPPPAEPVVGERSMRQGFSFTIQSNRFEKLEETDEKFSAVSFSDQDVKFFEKLAGGCNPEKDDLERHYRDVVEAYDELLKSKWQHKTTSLDWLLMGIYKGVTCGLAEFLRFDDVAVQASGTRLQGYKSVFRKAAHCFVLAGDRKAFKIKLSYYEAAATTRTLSDS